MNRSEAAMVDSMFDIEEGFGLPNSNGDDGLDDGCRELRMLGRVELAPSKLRLAADSVAFTLWFDIVADRLVTAMSQGELYDSLEVCCGF